MCSVLIHTFKLQCIFHWICRWLKTKYQTPNTYQLKFFVVITIYYVMSLNATTTKYFGWHLAFTKYLVFSHWLIQWKEHKYATKYLTKMLTLYLDRIQTENVFYALVKRIKCVWVAYKWSRPCRPYNSMYNTTVHCTAT